MHKLGFVLFILFWVAIIIQIMLLYNILLKEYDKHKITMVISKLYLPYFFIGFIFRLLMQSVPGYLINPYKILNIKKVIIAIVIALMSLVSINNFISCINLFAIACFLSFEKGVVFSLHFLFLNIILVFILSVVVSLYKIVNPILIVRLLLLSSFILIIYFAFKEIHTFLSLSEYIFFKIHDSFLYSLGLAFAAITLSVFFLKKIIQNLYAE